MSSGIPFVRELKFEYGRVDQITPLIRRVVAENAGPFTFHGTGTYIIGHGKVAVIDPGPLLDSHIHALMNALAGETVTHILITHTHRDHSPAAQPLKEATGSPVYAYGPHTLGSTWADNDPSETLGGDMDFEPDYLISDGDLITGPDWTIKAVHTPGHTNNHLCFALIEESVFFFER